MLTQMRAIVLLSPPDSILSLLSVPGHMTCMFSELVLSHGANDRSYVNVTNQPIFANASLNCDRQITLYNSSVSTGKNAAVGVKGDIFVAAPYLPVDSFFPDVHGLKVDIAFIENNMLKCSSLKGA
jgi:hypothetical protein